MQTITNSSSKCLGTVIFFHGSGDSGTGIRQWLKMELGEEFSFPHLNVVLPTAPARPYTPAGGALSNVWFDRNDISQNVPETESVKTMCENLEPLITDIVEKGVPKKNIILGGFSMGGCLAMHMAYRFHPDVAGCFVLSGFLNTGSSVYDAVQAAKIPVPPLFYAHGKDDELVHYDWGVNTYEQLKKLGVKGEFHSFDNLSHSLYRKELDLVKKWITQQIPE
ncbi:hypothetical protein LOTGIDRAFT_180286 [Lottia gigantea]|uniref:palmitoyl-protein hydrolase n=1 Tax=Lottia gigantea TaxID=225164 RepID=V4AC82_LOTGI|nr:hypothetical protein LOTGIDRAFT_180286 [Lottia gigantea]ESP01609.1 hypothetical protein LOTGIDRAFT_180286 [Lottia gigantea]